MSDTIDLKAILALPSHLQGAAYEAAAAGKPIYHLRAYATAVLARETAPAAFVSLDSEADSEMQIHERIASTSPEDIERWRVEILDDGMEVLLAALADGAAGLTRLCGRKITVRRARQIVTEAIKKAQRGDQGDLFDFASSPSPKPTPGTAEVEHD